LDRTIPLHTLRLYYPLIYAHDLDPVLRTLGLVNVHRDREQLIYAMPIEFPWRAMAEAKVVRWDAEKGIYQVRFYVSPIDAGKARVGSVYWTESINVLRQMGRKVMGQMFESVDDAEATMKCPACGEGWLGWQGADPCDAPRRPHVTCSHCDYSGPADGFRPVRELK
jgi:hypothetical protein